MTEPQSSDSGLGKRKRRLGADDEGPSSSRLRQSEEGAVGDSTRSHTGNLSTTSPHGSRHRISPTDQRPMKQVRLVSPKKANLQKQPSFQMDIEIEDRDSPTIHTHTHTHTHPNTTAHTHTHPAPTPASSSKNPDLRACHICKKAPKRKRDMINYLDCTRCIGRTCFICARDCSQCHKSLCRDCCTEVGEEGDAWCLDCYQRGVNT